MKNQRLIPVLFNTLNNTKNNRSDVKKIFFMLLSLGLVLSSSCAKKAAGVRGGQSRSQTRVVSPATSQASEQVASQQVLNYELVSVSTPDYDENSNTAVVQFEVSLPHGGGFMTFSTTHQLNQQTSDSFGSYRVQNSSDVLDFRARCEGVACARYLIMVTVVRNNYAYHQTVAQSLDYEDFFTKEVLNVNVKSLYTNLNDVSRVFSY